MFVKGIFLKKPYLLTVPLLYVKILKDNKLQKEDTEND